MNNEDHFPLGWEQACLGDLVLPKVEQGPPDEEVFYIDISSIDRERKRIGEVRTVTASDAPTRARQWVREGDVLVSLTRPNLNAVASVPARLDGAVASTGFDVLRSLWVLSDLLHFRVRSHEFVSDICKNLQGVVYPAVRPKDVRAHSMPVAPLPEQHRIVEALDSYFSRLDAAEEGLKRVEANLKRYRASVLKAAVEGRLVPTEAELARQESHDYESASVLLERILKERRRRWEEAELAKMEAKRKVPKSEKWKARYKDPVGPDTSDQFILPEGWCWATVDQLGLVASGQTPKGVDEQSKPDGAVPWYRVGDMNSQGNESLMTKSSVRLAADSVVSLGLSVRPEGTIIFPKRGGAINTNKKRRLGTSAAYDLNIMGVVPAPSGAEYLWIWFLKLDLSSLAGGSNVPQINHGDIRPLLVPLPPKHEQGRIAMEVERLLSLAEETRVDISRDVIRVARLRQAILKWAFEGRLVEQDPHDQPASALLEQIQAERLLKRGARGAAQMDLDI